MKLDSFLPKEIGLQLNTIIYRLSDGTLIKCFIYDRKGNDKINDLSESYYKKADGVMLIYDITNKQSFDDLKRIYIPIIKKNCNRKIKGLLLGNKTDLEKDRKVNLEAVKNLALENNFYFKETNGLNKDKIDDDAFQTLVEIIHFEKNTNHPERDDIAKKNCSIF